MGGVPGVPPAEAVVIGGGVVRDYATQMFLGMGAHVTVIDHLRCFNVLRTVSRIS
jgi:alanine dehydrogenase